MRPVHTAATSAQLDKASTTPLEVLMDRAGLAVALAAAEMGIGYGHRVAVLVGSGNNGGDGYIAAHYLAGRGVDVTIFEFAQPAGQLARWAADRAVRSGVKVQPWSEQVIPADLVIDGLFGGGFHGRLHDRIVPWTRSNLPVLAIDIPSGVDASTGVVDGPAFRAVRTVTFHALKVGHLVGAGADLCGEVTIADIGLEGGEAEFWVAEEADAIRPERSRQAHKWSVGSVMVVGGSAGMTGAAYLAAEAALQCGAGAVAVAVNRANAEDYRGFPAILRPVLGSREVWTGEDVPRVLDAAARFGVLVVGPGLEGSDDFILQILERRKGPVLLDAGGLRLPNLIDVVTQREGETLLTPHAGEFQAMTGEVGTYESAGRLAKETGATVLLKGSPTFVAESGRVGSKVVAVTTPGPELATIGTGDVLAGMIASRWAGGAPALSAAVSAAYWHGVAGAAISEETTVTAARLAAELGRWGL